MPRPTFVMSPDPPSRLTAGAVLVRLARRVVDLVGEYVLAAEQPVQLLTDDARQKFLRTDERTGQSGDADLRTRLSDEADDRVGDIGGFGVLDPTDTRRTRGEFGVHHRRQHGGERHAGLAVLQT